MKVKRIPFDQFKKIYSRVPRLCVEVVLMRGKSLLLIRRTIPPYKGQWHTPGGTVLKGESLEDTVRRVAKEELSAEVDVVKILGIIEYKPHEDHYGQDISVAFLVRSKTTKFYLDGHADKYDFFSKIPRNTIMEQKRFYKKVLGIGVK